MLALLSMMKWTAAAAGLSGLAWTADYGYMPAISGVIRPSGGIGTLPNGISDLAGNVWEWTDSCASDGFDPRRCPAYKLEGQHETILSIFVRDPFSGGCAAGTPPNHVGSAGTEPQPHFACMRHLPPV